MKMQVKRLNPRAKLPTYGTALSAGADLYVCLEEPVTIQPGQTLFCPRVWPIAVPEGYAGLVFARSGMACKRGWPRPIKLGLSMRTTGVRCRWPCTTTVLRRRQSATETGWPSFWWFRRCLRTWKKWRSWMKLPGLPAASAPQEAIKARRRRPLPPRLAAAPFPSHNW